MSDVDETVVVSPGARLLDGGGGFDVLDLGNLQGRWTSSYNSLYGSGGQMLLTDPTTGQVWSLDYANFEAFQGSPYADRIMGTATTTFIAGGAGNDTLSAQVMDTPYAITIFGGEGNDVISGSEMGDAVNGNQGDDVIHGWERDDWLYGGQNNDVIYGDEGNDNENGNLGNDTVDGGAGNDTLHGGQADDLVLGGAGNDYLSGDLGADTLTGGAGADLFQALAGGGDDRITDFNAAEGDRLLLAAGAGYVLSQSGPDAAISFVGGGSVVLAGVTLSSLPSGWIVEV